MLFSRSDKSPSRGGLGGLNFTEQVRVALREAREAAFRLGHEYVGTEHLLLGLLWDKQNPAGQVLAKLRVDPAEVRRRIEQSVKPGTARTSGPDLPYTSRAKKAVEFSMSAARELRYAYVGTEHLLIGLLREGKGIAAQVLESLGVSQDRVLEVLTGGGSFFAMEIDDNADRSIYQQIVDRVQEGVATGALRPGDRLPTVRRLADDLDIAPGTVARAYAELERLGVVVTEGTRGTRIAPSRPATAPAGVDRLQQLVGMLRPVAVAGYHLGANANDLRQALDLAMEDIYRAPGES